MREEIIMDLNHNLNDKLGLPKEKTKQKQHSKRVTSDYSQKEEQSQMS